MVDCGARGAQNGCGNRGDNDNDNDNVMTT